jgi:hypothetical protein
MKTVILDESGTVTEIANSVCEKLRIKNPEEYSLRVEGRPDSTSLPRYH